MATFSNGSTWYVWNSDTTSTATSTNEVWENWNNSTDSSSTWYYWNTTSVTVSSPTVDSNGIWGYWTQEPVIATSESYYPKVSKADKRRLKRKAERQRKVKLKAQRKAKIEAEKAIRKVKEAERKAKDLLLDVIGEDQLELFERTGRLIVKGRNFDWLIKRYKYPNQEDHTAQISISRIKKDKVWDLCVRLDDGRLPPSDKVLGFLLNAKYNEEDFSEKVNPTRQNGEIKDIGECANF